MFMSKLLLSYDLFMLTSMHLWFYHIVSLCSGCCVMEIGHVRSHMISGVKLIYSNMQLGVWLKFSNFLK